MKQLIVVYWPFAALILSVAVICFLGVIKKKFIPAIDIKSAIKVAKRLEKDGFVPIVNFLGEHYTSRNRVEQTANAYAFLINAIKKNNLKAKISVKPTQIGLAISKAIYLRNILWLVRRAHNQKVPLEIDMEELRFLEDTLEVFNQIPGHFNVRQAVQSYFKRSEDDLQKLVSRSARIRLVKGAYGESDLNREERKERFRFTEQLLLIGYDPTVATVRDKDLVEFIRRTRVKYHWNAKRLQQFSIQMLYGRADELKRHLYGDGFRVEVYVPVGHWHKALPYIWRRIKEVF